MPLRAAAASSSWRIDGGALRRARSTSRLFHRCRTLRAMRVMVVLLCGCWLMSELAGEQPGAERGERQRDEVCRGHRSRPGRRPGAASGGGVVRFLAGRGGGPAGPAGAARAAGGGGVAQQTVGVLSRDLVGDVCVHGVLRSSL